jgi:hypothetical protein
MAGYHPSQDLFQSRDAFYFHNNCRAVAPQHPPARASQVQSSASAVTQNQHTAGCDLNNRNQDASFAMISSQSSPTSNNICQWINIARKQPPAANDMNQDSDFMMRPGYASFNGDTYSNNFGFVMKLTTQQPLAAHHASMALALGQNFNPNPGTFHAHQMQQQPLNFMRVNGMTGGSITDIIPPQLNRFAGFDTTTSNRARLHDPLTPSEELIAPKDRLVDQTLLDNIPQETMLTAPPLQGNDACCNTLFSQAPEANTPDQAMNFQQLSDGNIDLSTKWQIQEPLDHFPSMSNQIMNFQELGDDEFDFSMLGIAQDHLVVSEQPNQAPPDERITLSHLAQVNAYVDEQLQIDPEISGKEKKEEKGRQEDIAGQSIQGLGGESEEVPPAGNPGGPVSQDGPAQEGQRDGPPPSIGEIATQIQWDLPSHWGPTEMTIWNLGGLMTKQNGRVDRDVGDEQGGVEEGPIRSPIADNSHPPHATKPETHVPVAVPQVPEQQETEVGGTYPQVSESANQWNRWSPNPDLPLPSIERADGGMAGPSFQGLVGNVEAPSPTGCSATTMTSNSSPSGTKKSPKKRRRSGKEDEPADRVERPTKRRSVTKYACKGCRKSKTQCNHGNPCSRCLKKEMICVYDHVDGRTNSTTRRRLQEMEDYTKKKCNALWRSQIYIHQMQQNVASQAGETAEAARRDLEAVLIAAGTMGSDPELWVEKVLAPGFPGWVPDEVGHYPKPSQENQDKLAGIRKQLRMYREQAVAALSRLEYEVDSVLNRDIVPGQAVPLPLLNPAHQTETHHRALKYDEDLRKLADGEQ